MKFNQLYQNIIHENYTETFWQDRNDKGDEIYVSIKDMEDFMKDKNIKTIFINVNDIKHLCLHKDKKDQETNDRVDRANLDFPILMIKRKSGSIIIDGHHRLQKAINMKMSKIKAKIINVDDLPETWQFLFN
jgi:hypothetical protein